MQHPMSQVAVLVIDMLNPYRHEDADVLAPNVADIVDPLARLISRTRDRDDVDLIYVNDNYGDFTADFDDVVDAALHGERPDLVSPIAPGENCLRLLKVRHSAFSASSLDYLLGRARCAAVDPDGSGHRAVHSVHRAGCLRAALLRRRCAGRRRTH